MKCRVSDPDPGVLVGSRPVSGQRRIPIRYKEGSDPDPYRKNVGSGSIFQKRRVRKLDPGRFRGPDPDGSS